MWRLLLIAFLFVHAAIHVAMWATPAPKDPNAPFDAGHSWLLGDQRAVATVLALAAAVLLVAAGIGLWAHAGWWRPVAVAALAVSFGLMIFYIPPVVPAHPGGQRRLDRGHRVAGLAVQDDGRRLAARRR